jgi:hypothetical protein
LITQTVSACRTRLSGANNTSQRRFTAAPDLPRPG